MEKIKPPISMEDSTLEKFPWGEIRWIWNSQIDKDAEQTLGHVVIHPGKKNAFHAHPSGTYKLNP